MKNDKFTSTDSVPSYLEAVQTSFVLLRCNAHNGSLVFVFVQRSEEWREGRLR